VARGKCPKRRIEILRGCGAWADLKSPDDSPQTKIAHDANAHKIGDAKLPTLATLVGFDGANGAGPSGALISDASGDLFGTTSVGGPSGGGTVFEIASTSGAYASTATTLVSFSHFGPQYGLVADAAGDLFGTTPTTITELGDGIVFEVVKTPDGYATTPTTLANFGGTDQAYPSGALIFDGVGNLIGPDASSVFEIAKSLTEKGLSDFRGL
jgi:hypothetical protein